MGWGRQGRWWDAEAWDRAHALVSPKDPGHLQTITMFYAEIGVLADRLGRSTTDDPRLPELPKAWTRLPNSVVLETLRADRKLASDHPEDTEAGINLLQSAISRAKRRASEHVADLAPPTTAPEQVRKAWRRTASTASAA